MCMDVVPGWRCAIALLFLAGCAPLVDMPSPSAHGPRVSNFRLSSAETMAGCPVDIIVQVDSVRGIAALARTDWTHSRGRSGSSGAVVLPLHAVTSVDSIPHDVTVRVVPERSGTYYYYVQIEDDAGRRSNVLHGKISVSPRWSQSPCTGSRPLGASS